MNPPLSFAFCMCNAKIYAPCLFQVYGLAKSENRTLRAMGLTITLGLN